MVTKDTLKWRKCSAFWGTNDSVFILAAFLHSITSQMSFQTCLPAQRFACRLEYKLLLILKWRREETFGQSVSFGCVVHRNGVYFIVFHNGSRYSQECPEAVLHNKTSLTGPYTVFQLSNQLIRGQHKV